MEQILDLLVPLNALTRRQLLGSAAVGICMSMTFLGALAHPATKRSQTQAPNSQRTSLHQEVEIHASPQKVYDALLNSKQFTAFTTAPAEISAKPGGPLSMFGGMITGRNVELVAGHRIVQAWRPGSWEPGVYSIVKFELKPNGPNTTVILDHTGFPEGDYDSLSSGWVSHYWKPLQKYFP